MNTLASNCHFRIGLSLAGALIVLAALFLPASPVEATAELGDGHIDPSIAPVKGSQSTLSSFSKLGGL